MRSGRWVEVYICIFIGFLLLFCLPYFVARVIQTTAKEGCESKEEPQGKEHLVLIVIVLRTDTLERVEL